MPFKLMFIVLFVFMGCKPKETANNTPQDLTPTNIEDISLKVYNYNGLAPFLNMKDDKVHVVNFWATWCAPCIKELPYFEALGNKYAHKNIEVLLVSLDFPHQYETKLKPFVLDKKLKSKVVALDDVDMNTWIPKVDSTWSGALPATLIYKNDKRMFFEQSFTQEELENQIKQFLNKK